MRLVMLAVGSRGDVQPYVALGRGLTAAGHQVRVLTTRDHASLLAAHDLEATVLGLDIRAALEEDDVMERGSQLASFRRIADIARRAAREMMQRGRELAEEADAIVTGVTGLFVGVSLAERLGRPLVQAYNLPLAPTGAFPGVLAPWMSWPPRGFFHRLSHRLTRQVVWTTMRSAGDQARREVLGLAPAPRLGPFDRGPLAEGPVLYGYSPSVLPPAPEWGARATVTGAWVLPAPSGWEPGPELESFLSRGPPPVFIGFGSMNSRDPEATGRLVLEAVRTAGVRAILQSGWSGLAAASVPDAVQLVDDVPHEWLFERMAAIVHHGGAGTTAAALRAGVPSMAVPFHGDQPFWGQRTAVLGVGPAPIPRRRLAAGSLAAALSALVSDEGAQHRAAELGRRIRAEDGVGAAMRAIEARFRPSRLGLTHHGQASPPEAPRTSPRPERRPP